MKISKELIEKYHDGACSDVEKALVERWLLDDESEEELLLPQEEKWKQQIEIWNGIAEILPDGGKEKGVINLKGRSLVPWKYLGAAAVLVAMLSSGLYFFQKPTVGPDIIVLNNASGSINKNLNEREYTISIGPKSNVEIDTEKGSIDFCGTVMINPKRDIELTIQGTCSKNADSSEKMRLKKGLNYIALNYSSPANESEMIILEEGSMMGLPPLVMKQLLHQFNI